MYISVTGHYGTVYREIVNYGTGNHMGIKAHMVPLVMSLSSKISFPHSSVLRICRSLSQAMMALCMKRCSKMGPGDHMAFMAHMVARVFV